MSSESTLNGHSYERTDLVLPNGSDARILLPDDNVGTAIPTLIFCHGNNGTVAQMEARGYQYFLDTIIGHGVAILQATAGAAVDDVGGNNYGNDYGQETYEQVVDAADAAFDTGALITMGSSAGGVVASNLACKHPTVASRIVGLCLHRGVTNAYRWRFGNNGGSNIPPTVYDPLWHKQQLGVYDGPYGVTSAATEAEYLASEVPDRDPNLFSDAEWEAAGKVLILVGDIDSTVPPMWHGQLLYEDRLESLLGADAVLKITEGSDHSPTSPSTYNETEVLRTWLIATVGESGGSGGGGGAVEQTELDIWYRYGGRTNRIVSATYYDGSRFYRLDQVALRPLADRNVTLEGTTTPSTP